MEVISNAMLIVSGVYLTLGVIYLRFWWTERARLAYLAFTSACFSYMFYSWLELGMLHAATPEEYLFFTWWAYLAGTVGLLSFAWFAYVHLHGRKWLLWTFSAVRVLAVIVHIAMPNGIHFLQVTAVGRRTLLGETLSYPIAVPNPWMLLNNFSLLVLTSFFLDASVRCWRRGERRTALVFGTGTVLFGTVTLIVPIGVLWGLAPIPLFASFSVLFIVVAMLYELNHELHRAAMLAEKLEEREIRLTETLDQLQLSAAAANVGLWTRKVGEEKVWLSEKAVDVWGFRSGEQVKREDIIQHIHPADRELYITNLRELEEWKNEYQIEYRLFSQDENIRWIHSRGKVEEVDGSRIIRGAIVDITSLKTAESRLTETLDQLQLSAAAANVGMWTRKIGGEKIWFNEKAGEIWGFTCPDEFSLEAFVQQIHPADRELYFTIVRGLEEGESEFQVEYRLLSKDGSVRWVHSRGKVETVNEARFIRGAIVDITKLKMAEEAIHELSHKLMNAQEKERARLARELHDDLSQSIAVLSIQMTMLRNEPKDLEYVKDQLDHHISTVKSLSSDVHRISHELHPAKLIHLGLETAMRGFCRELSDAHPLKIGFDVEDLPRNLPEDISLCLYRVTQESLQNVIKHSTATSAHVSIRSELGKIYLLVSDNGNGFDPDAAKAKESLGLVSIDERVRAVKGTVKITSRLGAGTNVEVYVPVGSSPEDGINNSQLLQSIS